MTCRNSFYRSALENLKRRLWLPAIILLYYFFAYPVAAGLSLSASSSFGYTTFAETVEGLREIFERKMGTPEFVMSVLFAVICAMQSFSYLHKKNRVDMYHSLPVSKRRQYAVTSINGLLIYIVPYALNLLLTYLIGSVFRAVTADSILYGAGNFCYAVLLYAAVYFTTAIAMMLTGNGGVAFVVAWILLLYEPIIKAVTELMKAAYFHTYVESESYVALTPLAIYAQSDIMKRLFGENPLMTFGTVMTDFGKLGLSVVAACLIGCLLYYKRPSEAHGKALAFSKSKLLFKFLLVIPFAVIMAVAFYGISRDSFIAAMFGLTIGVAIAHFVLEVIYEFDIRSILKHKLQLPVLFVVTCFIYCIFQFDIFGYDSYVPREAGVESAYIDLQGIDGEMDYFYENSKYYDRRDYITEHMYLTDIKPLIQIASASRDNASPSDITGRVITCTVAYRMKNGRTVKRLYHVSYEECKNELADIYESREYQEGIYQDILQLPETGVSEVLYQIGILESVEVSAVSPERILELYKKERQKMTFEEVMEESPVGMLHVEYVFAHNGEPGIYGGPAHTRKTCSYPVYASFEELLTELCAEEKILEVFLTGVNWNNGIYAPDVAEIEISMYYGGVEQTFIIDKPKQIHETVDALYYYYGGSRAYGVQERDDTYMVYVRMWDNTFYQYRNYYWSDCAFKEGGVPDFIVKAMEAQRK